MLTLGASIHKSLGDDREWGVHHFRHVDVKDEVGILEDVHPEPQRQAARVLKRGARNQSIITGCYRYYCFRTGGGGGVSSTALHPWINLSQGGISFHVWEHLPEVQLSAVQDNNSDGEKPFVSVSVYSEQYPWLSVYITVSHDADLCENYCCSRKIKWKRKKMISEDFFLTTKGICTKQHPMTLVYSNKQWLEMIKQLTSEVPLQPNNLKPRLHNAMLERSC